jgi:hypothetical protein
LISSKEFCEVWFSLEDLKKNRYFLDIKGFRVWVWDILLGGYFPWEDLLNITQLLFWVKWYQELESSLKEFANRYQHTHWSGGWRVPSRSIDKTKKDVIFCFNCWTWQFKRQMMLIRIVAGGTMSSGNVGGSCRASWWGVLCVGKLWLVFRSRHLVLWLLGTYGLRESE